MQKTQTPRAPATIRPWRQRISTRSSQSSSAHDYLEGVAIPSIVLIRHAQASFGGEDYDVLSERGHEQVTALVEGLRRRGIVADSVISGDLRRQRDTADPCAAALGLTASVDPRFNEYDDREILTHHARVPAGLEHRPGDAPMSSREFQEILNEALRGWIAAGEESPCVESWPAFQRKLTTALQDVASTLGGGQTALVISSGGAIGVLSAALLRLPAEAMIRFNHVSINTGITKLAVGRAGTTLVSANEHAHLDPGLVTYR